MGARFRLKAGYNISGFNSQAQVVLTAMKHYGLIVADNGSNWYFQGTMDAGWDNEPYATMVSQLKTIPASAFEAVDESSMWFHCKYMNESLPERRKDNVGLIITKVNDGSQSTAVGQAIDRAGGPVGLCDPRKPQPRRGRGAISGRFGGFAMS